MQERQDVLSELEAILEAKEQHVLEVWAAIEAVVREFSEAGYRRYVAPILQKRGGLSDERPRRLPSFGVSARSGDGGVGRATIEAHDKSEEGFNEIPPEEEMDDLNEPTEEDSASAPAAIPAPPEEVSLEVPTGEKDEGETEAEVEERIFEAGEDEAVPADAVVADEITGDLGNGLEESLEDDLDADFADFNDEEGSDDESGGLIEDDLIENTGDDFDPEELALLAEGEEEAGESELEDELEEDDLLTSMLADEEEGDASVEVSAEITGEDESEVAESAEPTLADTVQVGEEGEVQDEGIEEDDNDDDALLAALLGEDIDEEFIVRDDAKEFNPYEDI